MNSDIALMCDRLKSEDVVLVHVAHAHHLANKFNFRDLRGIVSRAVALDRPLRGDEVRSVIVWCEDQYAAMVAAAPGDPGIEMDLKEHTRDAELALTARETDIALEVLPHVCLYEPRADEFRAAAELGMTEGLVDRALFLDDLLDRECMFERMGVRLKRVTCSLEDMTAALAFIGGDARNARDVASAAEAVAFPKKAGEIRSARLVFKGV